MGPATVPTRRFPSDEGFAEAEELYARWHRREPTPEEIAEQNDFFRAWIEKVVVSPARRRGRPRKDALAPGGRRYRHTIRTRSGTSEGHPSSRMSVSIARARACHATHQRGERASGCFAARTSFSVRPAFRRLFWSFGRKAMGEYPSLDARVRAQDVIPPAAPRGATEVQADLEAMVVFG